MFASKIRTFDMKYYILQKKKNKQKIICLIFYLYFIYLFNHCYYRAIRKA